MMFTRWKVTYTEHYDCKGLIRTYKPSLSAASFVHKWNCDDSFPVLFLPVEVELKVKRVKFKDGESGSYIKSC
jgi:hypothetical protein